MAKQTSKTSKGKGTKGGKGTKTAKGKGKAAC